MADYNKGTVYNDQIIGAADGKVGFYGTTPVVQAGAITTLATDPTATDVATAVNSLIAAVSGIGITAK